MARRLWPSAEPTLFATLDKAVYAARGAAEVKASEALHCSALEIALVSEYLWGRSLTEEREARVWARSWQVPGITRPLRGTEGPARTTQAVRGHITRALLQELRPHLAGGKRRPKARRTR